MKVLVVDDDPDIVVAKMRIQTKLSSQNGSRYFNRQ